MTVVRESMNVLLVSAVEDCACEAQWTAIREDIKNCYGALPRRHHARVGEIKDAVVILEPLVKDVFAQVRNQFGLIVEPSEKVFFAYHIQDVKDRIEHARDALKGALVPYSWDKLPASKPVSYRRRLIEAREELYHIRNGPLAALKAMMDEEATSGHSLSYNKSSPGIPPIAVALPWPGALESPRGTVLGKEKCLGVLKEKLLMESSSSSPKLIGICGYGGVGKTTLARQVFEDQEVVKHFSGGRYWVGVTKNIPMLSVLNKLWAELLRESGSPGCTFSSLDEASSNIRGRINCFRGSVLLALDDVWQESQIAPILDLLTIPLSCQVHILMTTRYSRIVQRGEAFWYEARPLDLADSKKLICLHAFGEDSPSLEHSLNTLVEGVCSECQGLPLALKIVGSSLQGKSASEWKVAYRNLRISASITRRYHEAVFGSLSFSLDALHVEDPVLLDCFLDLAAYPEDYQIPVHELLLQWSTYDEVDNMEDALDLFMILVDFSMVSWSNQASQEAVRDPENSWSSQWSKQSEGRVFLDLGRCTFLDDVLRDLALILSSRKPYTGEAKGVRLNATELMEQGVERPPHLLDRLFVAGGRCCSSNFVLANGIDAQLKHCVFHGWDRRRKAEEEMEMEKCVGNPTPRRQEAKLASRNLSLVDGTFAEFSSNTAKRVLLKAENLQVLLAQGTRNEPCFLLEQLVRSTSGLRALNLHNCKTGKMPFDVTSLEGSFASLQVFDMGSEFPDELISNWPVDFGRMEKLRYLDARQNVVIGTSEREWLQEVCKLTSLTTLRMDSIRFEDNVVGEIPPEIGQLQRLTALSASACGITSIPEEMSCLSSLMFLDLSENELTELPDSLGDLPNLTSLDLYKNPIRELPSTIGRLKKLQSFRVGGWGCSLSYFPRSMCELTSLSTLWLGELENEGEGSGDDSVLTAASPGSQLRTRQDMVCLLSHLPKLRFLNLTWPAVGGYMTGDDADKPPADEPLAVDTGFDNLEELILCQFPSTQPAFVPRCSSLVNLYLEGGYQQRQRINDWNFRPLPHLRFVSISYIDDDELPPSLLDLHHLSVLQLEGCSSLRTLHLDCQRLLRVLRLSDCGSLTAVDVSMLCDLQTLELRNCPSVTSVNIGDLQGLQVVRLLSCQSLSEVRIRRTNRVQVLELIGCQALEDVNIKCLAQLRVLWLEECCMVKTLVFGSANQLQDLQLSECTALKYIDFEHLKHLQKLKLDACLSLIQVDVTSLASSLQSLVVSGCPGLQIIGPDHLRTSPLSPGSSKKGITTHIQKLDLSDCGSLVIVDVGRLDHLQDLLLSDCPNLQLIRGITASKLQSLYYERVHPDLDRTLQKLCQAKGNKLLDCTVRYGRTVQITDPCMKKL